MIERHITGLAYIVSREIAIDALEEWLAPYIAKRQQQDEKHKLDIEHYQRRCADYVRMTFWERLFAAKPKAPEYEMRVHYFGCTNVRCVESALDSMNISNSDSITIQTHKYEGAMIARIIIDYVDAQSKSSTTI